MSQTVKTLLTRFARLVDPKDTSGALITTTTVTTNDGDRFPVARRLDIYNEARWALYQAMMKVLGIEKVSEELYTILKSASVTFSGGVATLPTDFADVVSLYDSAGIIRVAPATIVDPILDSDEQHIQGVKYRDVFLQGNTLVDLTVGIVGAKTLLYFALIDWVLADIIATDPTETIDDKYHSTLLEIAQAIAREQGGVEVMKLAEQLIGAKAGNG